MPWMNDMEKNELILLAKNLMMETLYARSYKDIHSHNHEFEI